MVIIDRLQDFYHGGGDGDGNGDGDGSTIKVSPWARLLARLGAMLPCWPQIPKLARAIQQKPLESVKVYCTFKVGLHLTPSGFTFVPVKV